jgi:hypothetical protein
MVDLPFPKRRMTVVPIGTLTLDRSAETYGYELRRGVTTFPSVGDPLLLPTPDQLRALIEAQGEDRRVQIGTSPVGGGARVFVDPDKLFGRHLAVLGNTGSGKSCSVAGLIRWSLEAAQAGRAEREREGPPNARFLVLDPNGEYRETFNDLGDVRLFQVPPTVTPTRALQLPAWVWNSHEWSAFARAAPGAQRPLLLQALRLLRAGGTIGSSDETRLARVVHGFRLRIADIRALGPTMYTVFPQTKNLGRTLDALVESVEAYRARLPDHVDAIDQLVSTCTGILDNRTNQSGSATYYDAFAETDLDAMLEQIDALADPPPDVLMPAGASEDAPLPFDPSDLADALERLAGEQEISQASQFVATLTMRIRSMLADERLGPIVNPDESVDFESWLSDYVGTDGASNGRIAVIDLSLVPADVLHIVISVVARVVFEAIQRYRRRHNEELPTVLVLEEAHTFIQARLLEEDGITSPAAMCRATFERIAREGRKFGLGLVLSSQRPSELSPTALAQCNTFLLHRIVNDRDQELVSRLVPDNLGGLLRDLPSLPSQQAILLGWAAAAPVLLQVRHLALEHRPSAADPAFWEVWLGEKERPLDWDPIVGDWRGSSST